MPSKNVEQVLNGIKRLSEKERRELASHLSGLTKSGQFLSEESINDSLVKANTVYTAPIGGGGCACCGK